MDAANDLPIVRVGEVDAGAVDVLDGGAGVLESGGDDGKALLGLLGDVAVVCADWPDLAFAASTILGETIGVSRVSYGTIDPDAETLTVDRDWLAPGVESLAGTLNLRDYGSFIDSLKRGEFIVIPDVEKDERTAAAAEALKSRSAGAFVNVPVIERGRLVAVLFLNNAKAREWSDEDLSLVQEIAERTRTGTERLLAVAALRHATDTAGEGSRFLARGNLVG